MISADTLKFLSQLKNNNNRPWFEEHRQQFEVAKKDVEDFAAILIKNMGKFDRDILELEPKRCTFRQYRDVRFSHDKTPYKAHMGTFFNKGGKKINNAGYYLHIEPGKSLLAAGLWMPEAPDLKKVRQEIAYNYNDWEQIIHSREFIKYFPAGLDKTDSLKRAPKGYEEDDPAIESLKLRSFTATCALSDEELTNKGLLQRLVRSYKCAFPLVTFLNRAIE